MCFMGNNVHKLAIMKKIIHILFYNCNFPLRRKKDKTLRALNKYA